MSGGNTIFQLKRAGLDVQPGDEVPVCINIDMRQYDSYVIVHDWDAQVEADLFWRPDSNSTAIKEKTLLLTTTPQIVQGRTNSTYFRVVLRNVDVVPLTRLYVAIFGITAQRRNPCI